MSSEARYYYVDAQNQAAGPIALAGLLALKAAGTITDTTLVVAEGGTEWVAYSTLKP
ncbi:MAG: GYF domain-containing protein, partial [Candidatus Methylacidiphilales bacterium]